MCFMKTSEIFKLVEGKNGKLCEIIFKDGTITGKVIYYGTSTDQNDGYKKYVVISKEKKQQKFPYSEIETIKFID